MSTTTKTKKKKKLPKAQFDRELILFSASNERPRIDMNGEFFPTDDQIRWYKKCFDETKKAMGGTSGVKRYNLKVITRMFEEGAPMFVINELCEEYGVRFDPQ